MCQHGINEMIHSKIASEGGSVNECFQKYGKDQMTQLLLILGLGMKKMGTWIICA